MEPISITDQPEKENLPEQSPDEPVDNIEITHENETEINEEGDNRDEGETQTTVRRSLRQREPPKRLTYPQIGNPLVTIVQTLLQSLSTAITNSLVESSLTPLPEPEIV